MGLFSSKKKHYVDTQVVRMVPDEDLPNPVLTAILEQVFEDRELIDSWMDNALNGTFRNFERMYRWAATEGNYYYGLPDARVLSSNDGYDVAAEVLQHVATQETIEIDYIYYRPLNNLHAGWEHITEEWGYDHNTNQLAHFTALYGTEVYLLKMVAVHGTSPGLEPDTSSAGALSGSSEIGETPDRAGWDDPRVLEDLVVDQEYRIGENETESVEIHIIYVDEEHEDADENGLVEEVHIVGLESFDTEFEYYMARYRYTENDVEYIKYWTYDPRTGEYERLNNVFEPPEFVNPGTYFPFALFRSEGKNIADPANQTSEQYLTTVELLDQLDIDYLEMSESMHEDENIGDIDQAAMVMAVPINSDDPVDQKYLYEYFADIQERLPPGSDGNHYDASPDLQSPFGLSPSAGVNYAVQVMDADFEMVLSFDSIERGLKAGSIGPEDTVTGDWLEMAEQYGMFYENGFGLAPSGYAAPQEAIFRKQLSPVVYDEIIVRNPRVRYRIYKDKGVEGGFSDDRTLVPLDYNITSRMGGIDLEQLYYRAAHIVFNSHVVQKIKWYERGIFKVILLVVAIVLTISGNWTAWKAAVAAVSGAAAVTLVILKIILVEVFKTLVWKFIYREVASAIGEENAFWIAFAAVVTGTVQAMRGGGTIAGATAENLLKFGIGLSSGAQDSLKEMFADLESDIADFEAYAEEKMDELEEAMELLSAGVTLDPLTFVRRQPLFVPGETPDAFYNRTVHSGNIGAKSLNLIENYVEISLTLPTVQESVG